MREFINRLKIPEKSGKKIGLFRIVCAIFGGLLIALLLMALLITLTPTNKESMTLATILIDGSVWAILAFWISLSSSKYIALKRAVIPIFVLAVILLIVY